MAFASQWFDESTSIGMVFVHDEDGEMWRTRSDTLQGLRFLGCHKVNSVTLLLPGAESSRKHPFEERRRQHAAFGLEKSWDFQAFSLTTVVETCQRADI